ncbi:MAG TPA: hypothetical protein VKA59_14365 [Vicinamibacterales bacterium]|nr:hypothetical protein [Vicinamibacterales bacterium]
MSLTEPLDESGSPGPGAQEHRSPRVPVAQIGKPRARLLPGGDVDVINISDTGLLVEGKARPGVGTIVTVRIQGSRAKLEGRIVRSKISTIHRDGTLSYESAIEFDTPTAVRDIVDFPAAEQAATGEVDQDVYVIDGDNDW